MIPKASIGSYFNMERQPRIYPEEAKAFEKARKLVRVGTMVLGMYYAAFSSTPIYDAVSGDLGSRIAEKGNPDQISTESAVVVQTGFGVSSAAVGVGMLGMGIFKLRREKPSRK